MIRVNANSKDLYDLLDFYEQEKEEGRYPDLNHKEEKDIGDISLLQGDLISILFSAEMTIVGALIIDYFQKNKKHEVTFETTNSIGEKMTITLKNLTTEEVKEAYNNFQSR